MNTLTVYATAPAEWLERWSEAWGVRCAELAEADRADETTAGGAACDR